MMKAFFALFLLFALSACSAPKPEEAGPPPVDYKTAIEHNMMLSFHDPDSFRGVAITEPQPGRVQFIPGWRVCVRVDAHDGNGAYTGPINYAYFFVDGKLQSVVTGDEPCASYSYVSWPEIDKGKAKAFVFHTVWQYQVAHDDLRQTTLPYAHRGSNNSFALKFPYKDSHGSLDITKTSSGFEFALSLSSGQIDCKKIGCKLLLRFDNAAAEDVAFVHDQPTDKERVVAVNSQHLINQLKTSKSLIVEVDIPGNGSKQYVFDTDGFDMNHLENGPWDPTIVAFFPHLN